MSLGYIRSCFWTAPYGYRAAAIKNVTSCLLRDQTQIWKCMYLSLCCTQWQIILSALCVYGSMTIWWELIRRDTLMPVLVIHIDPPLTDSGLDVASLYRQTIHFPPASLPFLKTRNEQRSTSPDTMAESFCFCSATIQITEFLEQLVLKIVQSVQWHVTVLCNVCMISTRPQWGDRDHTASKSLNLTNRIFLSTKSKPFLLSISSNRYVSHRSFLQKKFWI